MAQDCRSRIIGRRGEGNGASMAIQDGPHHSCRAFCSGPMIKPEWTKFGQLGSGWCSFANLNPVIHNRDVNSGFVDICCINIISS